MDTKNKLNLFIKEKINNKISLQKISILEDIKFNELIDIELKRDLDEQVNNFLKLDSCAYDLIEKELKSKYTHLTTTINEYNFDEIADDYLDKEIIDKQEFLQLKKIFRKDVNKAISDFNNMVRKKYISEIIIEYLKQLDEKRKDFIKQLLNKLELIKKLTQNLKVFKNVFDRFWDLSEHDLFKIDISLLNQLQDLLNKNNFVEKIANLLGRLANSLKEYEIEQITKSKFIPSNKKVFDSPENITSIKFGNEINQILKYQLAFRYHKNLKPIFDLNYSEKKLLQIEQKIKLLDEVTYKETRLKPKKINKGPFIMCIDTSGSMHGEPENIAKSMALAIFKIALKQNRKCFVINFSTNITEFDASDIQNSFSKFLDFLRLSFGGGTDVQPAINRALEKLKENNYQNADVIIISDFIMNTLSNELKTQIDQFKVKKVRFHALTIGKSFNENIKSNYDNFWIYDGSKESIDKIIRDLSNINKKS